MDISKYNKFYNYLVDCNANLMPKPKSLINNGTVFLVL
jgi:hypothetical protein